MSTGVQTAIGKFVWHDNNTTDIDKARRFYTELLGWDIEVWKPGEMDYPMIKVGEQMHGGFGPAQGGAPSHWLGHVLVKDVDETARKAEGAGGRILAGPMDIPEVGRFAVIADPKGAVLSAFTPSGELPPSEGVFVWDELATTDVDGAKSFYTEIFDWTTSEMDMGQMTYTIFKRAGDVDAAGCLQHPEGTGAQSAWVPYIATNDVDATTKRAKDLGATIFREPTDIPDMGRFSIVQDPVGAVFGLWQSFST